MTERLAEWDHDQFKKIIVKVANMEIAYKAIAFYLDRQVGLYHQMHVDQTKLTSSQNCYPTS
jgi:hypothetical protein